MNNVSEEKVTISDVFTIAIPMILASITIPLLGLVDTAIVGHLNDPEFLSSVEIGDTVFNFTYMLFSFLRLGITGLTAQANGRRAYEELNIIMFQGLFLSCVFGLLIAFIPNGLIAWFLFHFSPDHTTHVLAVSYLQIRLYSAPAVLMNLAISAFLLGTRYPKYAMFQLVLTNVIAMILDVVLVFGFHKGIYGLAYAGLCGQYIGLIYGLIVIYSVQKTYLEHLNSKIIPYLVKGFLKFITVNSNFLIRSFCFITVYTIFLSTSAKLGTLTLAANSILLAFYSFISLGLEGFSNAAEVLVGNAVGKNNEVLLRQSITVSSWCLFIAGMLITLIYAIFGVSIISMLTDIEVVRLLADKYLLWIVLLPLICVWCYLFDAIFLGMLRIAAMRNSLIIATFFFFIPLWTTTKSIGNHGLWLAFSGFFLGRTLVLLFTWIYEAEKRFQPSRYSTD